MNTKSNSRMSTSTSGDDSAHQVDGVIGKDDPRRAMPTSESSQRIQSQSAQPNVYTPLSLPPRTESQQNSPNSEELLQEEVYALKNTNFNNETVSGKSKSNSSSRYQAVKNQRSSVRPFFCCASELSLVSLVDGMELKDMSHRNNRNIQSIECSCSSDDEALEPFPLRSRSNTLGSIEIPRPTTVRRKKKDKHVMKKKSWSLRLQSRWSPRWRSRQSASKRSKCARDLSQESIASGCSNSYSTAGPSGLNRQSPAVTSVSTATSQSPLFDLFGIFPVQDIADAALRRSDELAGFHSHTNSLSRAFRSNIDMAGSVLDILRIRNRVRTANAPIQDLLMSNLMSQVQTPSGSMESRGGFAVPQIHTSVDYVHYLVPELTKITGCSYYWGVMDRYEAEHLLENKPPGTFLLRDSAQEDFLFSVSFRRYNRSLHARIEQWNHRFSFDALDQNVFSACTVCDLMEHYKDPSLCMFFEPMLTRPLHRNFPFSLQHMSRTVICDRISYDDIQSLPIPNSFKKYLQTYHYKLKVRVRRFDSPEMASADSRVIIN